jgi:oligoendopeptidase F
MYSQPAHFFRLFVLQSKEDLSADFRKERDRSRLPEKYKWDLSAIYKSDAEWSKARETVKSALPTLDRHRQLMRTSASALADCLDLITSTSMEYARLYCYASMKSDEDTRDAIHLGMEQEISQLGADFSARVAFLQPEILALGEDVISEWMKKEPRLKIYRHSLDDILRRQEHTGTEEEEKILANASLVSDGAQNIYSVFTNADFPYAHVTMGDGESIKLDQAAFSLQRARTNREDRRRVFESYFGALGGFQRTFGSALSIEVKKNMFFARSRHYPSALARALDGNNIPPAVYHGLIQSVRQNLGSFHRYLKLRKKLLGVEQLHYYDLYVPVVPELDLEYTYEEACEHILASLAPLGEEYCRVARKALTERWVDVYPGEGKRSGAYSNGGVYEVHPYILLNYNGKYDDVSTLAHELGHTMHSHITNMTQPYATSDYSIFVAEVASTLNEALLAYHMLKALPDSRSRLSLLAHELDGIRGTVFRQTQFAEYELRIHEKSEKGEALTGESLGGLYEGIAKEYYAHDTGVCIVDPEIRHEWAHIPHFYYNFYVFQYATSYTASSAIAEMILAGDSKATERYLELLSAGGSDYPIALLNRAGVDMTTSVPFALTMKRMNRIMDEIERIVG